MVDPEWSERVGDPKWWLWTATAIGILALVFGLVGCTPVPPDQPRADVILWGDSFGESVQTHLPYEEHVFGGTSPCDWLDDLVPSDMAVFLFVGNKLDTCDYGLAVYLIEVWAQNNSVETVWIAAPPWPTGPAAVNAYYHYLPACWSPAIAVGSPNYLPQYRSADAFHLNDVGAQLFANGIEECVSNV